MNAVVLMLSCLACTSLAVFTPTSHWQESESEISEGRRKTLAALLLSFSPAISHTSSWVLVPHSGVGLHITSGINGFHRIQKDPCTNSFRLQGVRSLASFRSGTSRVGDVRACAGKITESDNIRLARARLSEEYWEKVRKRKPRFLPFVRARQWARAMSLETEEEWKEWISNGEKSNAYIPSRPDEVYADVGWEGWHDFLNGAIEPASVVLKEGYRRGRLLQGPVQDVRSLRPEDNEAKG